VSNQVIYSLQFRPEEPAHVKPMRHCDHQSLFVVLRNHCLNAATSAASRLPNKS